MKIKIAVCDDEPQTAQYIAALTQKWAESARVDVNVSMFESAEKFKSALSDGEIFDVLLLDIEMSGQNDMDLARELRKNSANLIIIFITGFADFIGEGYDVAALNYLLKPVKEQKLFEVLDKAYKNLISLIEEKKFLIVNSNGKDYKISLDDILYIEALKHYINIVTSDGKSLEIRQNIGEIEHELHNSFFRCQRSYIVSLAHIKYISKTDVTLDNGEKISLSRNIYKDLYQEFIKYFKGDDNI